jgi:hypothetical protein
MADPVKMDEDELGVKSGSAPSSPEKIRKSETHKASPSTSKSHSQTDSDTKDVSGSANRTRNPQNVALNASSVSKLAYSKMILHACKHPSRPVLGVLLTSKDSSDKDSKSDSRQIVDVVPLFHDYTLAPMMEVAMTQIEEFCKLSGKFEIAGCYSANELYTDRDPDHMTEKFATKIADHYPAACILMIDNTAIADAGKKNKSSALLTYRLKAGQWRHAEPASSCHPAPADVTAVLKDVMDGKERDIIDFEEHLEDPELQWLP